MSHVSEAAPAQSSSASEATASRRLMSLDALRGFDMFWIIGAESLVAALHRMSPSRPVTFLAYELQHSDWEGFRFYDLIFPLFIFIAGVSMVFSLPKTIASAGRVEAIKRIVIRSVLLFLLGVFYNGGLATPWPDVRIMSVLGRIGLAYLFAGILFCLLKPRSLATVLVGLLLGYWALLALAPFPDVRPTPQPEIISRETGYTNTSQLNFASTNYLRGTFIKGVNLSNYMDQKYLPGSKSSTWDPEGILSTLPSIATCLLGIFAGLLLQNSRVTDPRKVVWLLAWGVAGIGLGSLWGCQFPVIKKIWTSSYVLVSGGYSAILLGVFYLVVDVLHWRRWCQPFVWIGMNSITLYLAANVLGGFGKLAQRLTGGSIGAFFDPHVTQGCGQLITSLTGLALAFGFAHFLYQRKVFLRL